MPPLTLDEKVDLLMTDMTEVKTYLKGYGGNPGLGERHEKLANDYYKFKRWVIGIFFFMVGSGVITVGVIKSIEMMNG